MKRRQGTEKERTQGTDSRNGLKERTQGTDLESKGGCGGEHGPHIIVLIVGLALDVRLRARSTCRRRARRARTRLRALDDGASRARARRAFTDLTGLRARGNTRRAFRNRRLENVFRHVGKWRTFRFQHVLGHVGHRGARRNRGFQNPFTRVGKRTRRTIGLSKLLGFAGARRLAARRASRCRFLGRFLRRFLRRASTRPRFLTPIAIPIFKVLFSALIHKVDDAYNSKNHKDWKDLKSYHRNIQCSQWSILCHSSI